MIVPCLMGLKCAHCICDDDGDPACCYPYTIDTIDEERWAESEGLCLDKTECPLVEDGSDLEYLLRFGTEYDAEQWAYDPRLDNFAPSALPASPRRSGPGASGR